MSTRKPDRIPYTHRTHRRTKSITLRVREGRVVVVTPPRVRKSFLDRVIQGNTGWIIDKLRAFEMQPVVTKPGRPERARLRTQALQVVREHIAELNAHYGFSYNRIAIRDQRTRWGSCSSRRNLNFNYRIVHLPHELARYLVAHELCHLAHMNHGPQFWKLVEETVPDYRRLRLELRKTKMAR